MLLELHVKNLALIEKADVEFGEGLNILTGETGAGKSIIIGSVTMALGGKASKDVIRRGADHAYIELIFFVDSKEKKKWICDTFDAYCAEMEGAAVAQAAYLNKIPYLIVRAISDKADDSAHMDYGEFEAKAVEHSVNLMLALVKRL